MDGVPQKYWVQPLPLSHSNSPTLEHDFVTPLITKAIYDFLIN